MTDPKPIGYIIGGGLKDLFPQLTMGLAPLIVVLKTLAEFPETVVLPGRVSRKAPGAERAIAPFTLRENAGVVNVPSPLKTITSMMAFGCGTPLTMLYPVAAKT